MGRYRIGTDKDAPVIEVAGRQEWALKQLIEAGETGCTSVTNSGPRWSSYVHRLRSKGLIIETVYEPHGGSWPGRHGRYILRSCVEPLPANDDEALVRRPSDRRAA